MDEGPSLPLRAKQALASCNRLPGMLFYNTSTYSKLQLKQQYLLAQLCAAAAALQVSSLSLSYSPSPHTHLSSLYYIERESAIKLLKLPWLVWFTGLVSPLSLTLSQQYSLHVSLEIPSSILVSFFFPPFLLLFSFFPLFCSSLLFFFFFPLFLLFISSFFPLFPFPVHQWTDGGCHKIFQGKPGFQ